MKPLTEKECLTFGSLLYRLQNAGSVLNPATEPASLVAFQYKDEDTTVETFMVACFDSTDFSLLNAFQSARNCAPEDRPDCIADIINWLKDWAEGRVENADVLQAVFDKVEASLH